MAGFHENIVLEIILIQNGGYPSSCQLYSQQRRGRQVSQSSKRIGHQNSGLEYFCIIQDFLINKSV